jgi:hypothetical protein
MKGLEPGGRVYEAVVDTLSEDRSEEDGVGSIALGDLNLGEGVAGDGDDGVREAEARVASSYVVGKQRRVCGEVETVCLDFDSDGETAIDEQARRGGFGGDDGEHLSGEPGEVGGRKVFLAELDEVDAAAGPEGRLVDEGGLSVGLVAGKKRSVGDGAAEHVDKCSGKTGESVTGD